MILVNRRPPLSNRRPSCAGDIGTDKAKKLNLQAALSSLVLLQNPGILPLKGWGEDLGDRLGNMCVCVTHVSLAVSKFDRLLSWSFERTMQDTATYPIIFRCFCFAGAELYKILYKSKICFE